MIIKEDCGCKGKAKETSEDSYMASSQLHSIAGKAEDMYTKLEKDEVLDDWIESHLAKIDQMMDSVSDSFNHDQSKESDDMDTGQCPPGQHWCNKSNECHDDHSPLSEEFEYEPVLEDSSSRLPEHFYEDDYTLDEGDLDVIFDETRRGDRVRYFVDVYYDTMLPSSGDVEKDKILAEKMARTDLRSLKNREYIIGPVELRGYYR
jgi:hypothetical protein